MSDNTQSSSTVEVTASASTSTATENNTPTKQADSFTQVNSLSDLKTKAPEVYQKMMEGIAMKICNEMKASQERIKDMNREARNNVS